MSSKQNLFHVQAVPKLVELQQICINLFQNCIIWYVICFSYLVRPSPFSAQKTFERHNSRRKSNISFCSQAINNLPGSRRGSGIIFPSPRAPPLVTTKANSLSLPDSPTVAGTFRGRSNSLRVVDDILLRRSNSLRQGLVQATRKSSLEEIGIGLHYPPVSILIKIFFCNFNCKMQLQCTLQHFFINSAPKHDYLRICTATINLNCLHFLTFPF